MIGFQPLSRKKSIIWIVDIKFHPLLVVRKANLKYTAWEPSSVTQGVIVSPTDYPPFVLNYGFSYLPDKSRPT